MLTSDVTTHRSIASSPGKAVAPCKTCFPPGLKGSNYHKQFASPEASNACATEQKPRLFYRWSRTLAQQHNLTSPFSCAEELRLVQAQVRVGRVSVSRFLGFEAWWQRWAGRRFCARVLQPSLSTLPDAHRGMALLRHLVVFKRFLRNRSKNPVGREPTIRTPGPKSYGGSSTT